jgi:hypothetical protein
MPAHIGTLTAILARSAIGVVPGNPADMAKAIGWHSAEQMLRKAAVGSLSTQFSEAAGTGIDLTGFIGSLRGLSFAAEVAARAQQWPLHARVGVLTEEGFAAGEITEENPVAPILLSNGLVLIQPSKVSAIIVLSEELVRMRGAADAIQAELRKAIGRGLDKALISRIAPGSAGGFNATASAPADIATLVGMLARTGNEPLVAGAAVDTNILAATLIQDGDEVFEEVMLTGMGQHKGIPWVPVEVLDAGKLLLVDPSGLAFVIESVEIAVGRSAALFQDSAATPGAQQMTSVFQANALAVRADLTFAIQIMRERDVSAECVSIGWVSS